MRIPNATTRPSSRGFATVLVFILLVLIGAYVVATARTLNHLKAEIRLIEKRQLEAGTTSAQKPPPPAKPSAP